MGLIDKDFVETLGLDFSHKPEQDIPTDCDIDCKDKKSVSTELRLGTNGTNSKFIGPAYQVVLKGHGRNDDKIELVLLLQGTKKEQQRLSRTSRKNTKHIFFGMKNHINSNSLLEAGELSPWRLEQGLKETKTFSMDWDLVILNSAAGLTGGWTGIIIGKQIL